MYSYMGRIARINLTDQTVSYEFPEEKVLRQHFGGTGLGMYYLYKEVPAGTKWSDPKNLFMIMSGPMGGSPGPGGLVSVVAMGAKTDSVAAAQANGRMGSFLKFCGFDGLIFEGKAERMVYVHISEDHVEFRDASRLKGMDTWEATEAVEQELGKGEEEMSVMTNGPAGENGVLFASTCSERGHIAAHGGTGAVMASKNLKAVAVERGTKEVKFYDLDGLWRTMRELIVTKGYASPAKTHKYGTTTGIIGNAANFMIPVKNYTAADYETYFCLGGPSYEKHVEKTHIPCYGCAYRHCYRITVKDGKFAGETGDEMEYETVAGVGSNSGCTDAIAVQMLGNFIDKMCMDSNEVGWIMGWLMECYEKGICTKADLDGLEMTWGNSEAMCEMVRRIAYKEGPVGSALANGLSYAAEVLFDGKGRDFAVYTKRGNTPRGHDHRGLQNHIVDTVTGGIGTDEIGVLFPNLKVLELPEDLDKSTAEDCGKIVAGCYKKGVKTLLDSFPLCYFGVTGATAEDLLRLIKLATGWDIDEEELSLSCQRISYLIRSFGVRNAGFTKDMEAPSTRYGSAAIAGPQTGKAILDIWPEVLDNFYRAMEWDIETGKPLPDKLRELDLDYVIKDLWPGEESCCR